MRRVRTVAGAAFYGQPIGTVIEEDDPDFGDWLRARHPGMDISITRAWAGHYVLHMIRTPKGERGRGRAKAVMADLVAVADELGMTVSLSPESPADERSSKGRLTQFYRSFGFTPNKGRVRNSIISETMVRHPQAVDNPVDEEKALRRVRTPGGEELYDLPIGSVITTDVEQAVRRDPRRGIESTDEVDRSKGEDPGDGSIALTRIFVTPAGEKGVSKVMRPKQVDAKHQLDAEVLTALVGRAAAAMVPDVYEVAPTEGDEDTAEVWMPYIEHDEAAKQTPERMPIPFLFGYRRMSISGREGIVIFNNATNEPVEWERPGLPKMYDDLREARVDRTIPLLEEHVKQERSAKLSDDELFLGLLDIITFNVDRNAGNWLVTKEGDTVGIDHGHAFWDQSMHGGNEDFQRRHTEIDGVIFPSVIGYFSEHFYTPRTDDEVLDGTMNERQLVDHDISPNDMALIRRALEDLRPEFEQRDREDWFEAMMARFTALEAHATGTKDRLAEDTEEQE